MEEATAMMSDRDWYRVGNVYSARRRGSLGIKYMEIFKGFPKFDERNRKPLTIRAMADYVAVYSERRRFRMTGQPRIQRTVWRWQERMA